MRLQSKKVLQNFWHLVPIPPDYGANIKKGVSVSETPFL
jgi:hypothetical protein